MTFISRRSFLKTTATAAILSQYAPAHADATPGLTVKDRVASFRSTRYSFEFTAATDIFAVLDSSGRTIFSAPLQPVVCTSPVENPHMRLNQNGVLGTMEVEGNTLKLSYNSVNGSGILELQLRFEEECFWIDPPTYDGSGIRREIVSLSYFATTRENHILPGLHATYTTIPGISEGSAVSPVQGEGTALDTSISLGRGGFYVSPYLHQQWGLPVHYFCVTSTTTRAIDGGRLNSFTSKRSDTAVCGIADLPNGDIFFDLKAHGMSSLWVDYRSDLWHHVGAEGKVQLGCTLIFAFGADQRSAAISYGDQLVRAGIIDRKKNSVAKNAAVFAPEFCTWGAQVVRNEPGDKLTQSVVEGLYAEMKASGMKAAIFSIDDKWEGRYGNLEHDHTRLPRFVEFLDRIRSEGHLVGLWTAFMRCEKPEDLGLSERHMLQEPTGKPYMGGGHQYFLLDFTQPEVARVLAERARNFMRVYKPALVKFDFGYELPAMRSAAPADKQHSGERLLKLGLDIVIGALREINPDVVVMYYQLSPLLAKYFDLHSTDDLFLTAGDYNTEANRRIYLGSTLSSLGIATYGSSGYDWSSSPSIWFDSVVSGTLGCLNDFKGDEFGETPTPDMIALYNGLAKAIRPENLFDVIPYPPVRPEASGSGLHSRSWARLANGRVVMIAQRPPSFDDGDSVDHRPVDFRVANLVRTTAPVVISSATDDSLSSSARLVIVPCAEGQMSLRRQKGSKVKATVHLLGGTTTSSTATIEDGWLSLKLSRTGSNALPVEFVELDIS